jgi:hypothetical protein
MYFESIGTHTHKFVHSSVGVSIAQQTENIMIHHIPRLSYAFSLDDEVKAFHL